MSGAASQCDTFDYKPELIKRNGQKFDPGGKVELFQSVPGAVHEEPVGLEAARPVRQVGQRPGAAPGRAASTTWLHPFDDGEVERPRAGDVHAEHRLRAARFSRDGRLGQSYGLGSLNDEPADVRRAAGLAGLRPERAGQLGRRLPAGRAPGHDGPARRRSPIFDLFAARRSSFVTEGEPGRRPGPARTSSTAQHAASARRHPPGGAHRLLRAGGPAAAQRARGARHLQGNRRRRSSSTAWTIRSREDFGRNCLIARRLLERGVRFVQVWSGADNGFPRRNWDCHENIAQGPRRDGRQHGPARRRPASRT